MNQLRNLDMANRSKIKNRKKGVGAKGPGH